MGDRTPIRPQGTGALAHAHGALLVVDAMQSAGVVPIDVQASDVDVLATGSFKWLCGFSGSGVCYVRPELGERLRPIFVGSLTLDPAPPWRETGVSQEDAVAGRRLEYASSAHTLRVALAAAIDYWLAVGPERVLRHVLGLTARIADGVGLLGGTVLTPPEDSRAGILTAVFPGQDPDRLVSALEERQVAVCARGWVVSDSRRMPSTTRSTWTVHLRRSKRSFVAENRATRTRSAPTGSSRTRRLQRSGEA